MAQATAILKTTDRRIRHWIEDGTIRASTRPVEGRRPLAIVNPLDVEKLRIERNPAEIVHQEVAPRVPDVPEASGSVARLVQLLDAAPAGTVGKIIDLMFARAPMSMPPQQPPKSFLGLTAAAEYSGLPAALVKRMILDNELPARRWKREFWIRRADLDALTFGEKKGELYT